MATNTGIRMTLGEAREWKGVDGKLYRSEQWTIIGGEVDPSWQRKVNSRGQDVGSHEAGWEPSSRFTLYVIDGEVDARLVSYGGVVWPIAWTQLFETRGQGYSRCVAITDQGLMFRAAALEGASDMYADVRLS
jgi:hypothetical protein